MIKKFFTAVIFTLLIALAQNVSASDYDLDYFQFQGHVEGYGWMEPVGNGDVIGTTGQNLRLEAMVINFRGGIRYCAHVENIGWMDWVYSGEVAGTVGESLRMEAVRIQLTGRSEQYWDIYYRAHVEDIGWLGWAKNGEPAGTEGAGLRMEALQIQLVEKGERFRRGNQRPFYRERSDAPMY